MDLEIETVECSRIGLATLPVYIWGFPSKSIENFPDGKEVEGELYSTRIPVRFSARAADGNKKWNQNPQINISVYRIAGKFDIGFGGAPVYSQIQSKVVGIICANDEEYGYAIPVEEIAQKFKSISVTSPISLHENDEIDSKLFSREEFSIDDKLCFVLMTFGDKYRPVYDDVIVPTVKESGLDAKRADDIFDVKQPIMQDVWKYINKAKLIISDLSDRNPNVFYEVGLSHAIGKKVILITRNLEDVPFDLRHLRCIVYQDSIRGVNILKNSLVQTIKQIL